MSENFQDEKDILQEYPHVAEFIPSLQSVGETDGFLLPSDDGRVEQIEVTCEDCVVRIWVEIELSMLDGEIDTSDTATLELYLKQQTLVDVLGVSGVFKELFLFIEHSTEFSKRDVSNLLRNDVEFFDVHASMGDWTTYTASFDVEFPLEKVARS